MAEAAAEAAADGGSGGSGEEGGGGRGGEDRKRRHAGEGREDKHKKHKEHKEHKEHTKNGFRAQIGEDSVCTSSRAGLQGEDRAGLKPAPGHHPGPPGPQKTLLLISGPVRPQEGSQEVRTHVFSFYTPVIPQNP